MNESKESEREVGCDRCSATPGEPCRTPQGKTTTSHKVRKIAWIAKSSLRYAREGPPPRQQVLAGALLLEEAIGPNWYDQIDLARLEAKFEYAEHGVLGQLCTPEALKAMPPRHRGPGDRDEAMARWLGCPEKGADRSTWRFQHGHMVSPDADADRTLHDIQEDYEALKAEWLELIATRNTS